MIRCSLIPHITNCSKSCTPPLVQLAIMASSTQPEQSGPASNQPTNTRILASGPIPTLSLDCDSFSGVPLLASAGNSICGTKTNNRTLTQTCCNGAEVIESLGCFQHCQIENFNPSDMRDFVACLSNGGNSSSPVNADDADPNVFCQGQLNSTVDTQRLEVDRVLRLHHNDRATALRDSHSRVYCHHRRKLRSDSPGRSSRHRRRHKVQHRIFLLHSRSNWHGIIYRSQPYNCRRRCIRRTIRRVFRSSGRFDRTPSTLCGQQHDGSKAMGRWNR